MAINDAFVVSNASLADQTDWVIDASTSGTGAVIVTELAGGAAVEIYRELDPDGDGTYELRSQIDSATGTWHSTGNELLLSTADNLRLVIRNVSGGTSGFSAAGYEVDS